MKQEERDAIRRSARIFGVTLPTAQLPLATETNADIVMPDQWEAMLALIPRTMDRVALALLYRLGLRVSEACGLKTESYDPETREVIVQGRTVGTWRGREFENENFKTQPYSEVGK